MADSNSPTPPLILHRPWYRLHFSTWLVVLLGLGVAVLLIVPGEEGYYPERSSQDAERAMRHGWPVTFLWRTPGNWWRFDDSKSPFIWNLFDSSKEFRAAVLVIDIAINLLIIGVVVGLWEWRRRLRFRFSLRSLLVGVMLFGLVLGWWGMERRADEELRGHLAEVEARAAAVSIAQYRIPRYPLWVRAIIGDERLNNLGITRLRPGIRLIWSPAKHEHVKYLIDRSPTDVDLEINKAPDDDKLAKFLELTRIETLILHDAPARLVCRLTALPALRSLFIGAHNTGALDDAGLVCLAKLTSLRTLEVIDAHRITDDAMAQLAESSRLESLSLWRSKLTRTGLASIAAMRNLRELTLVVLPITDDDLKPLAKNNRIETVLLSCSLITDRSLQMFQTMPVLKRLHLPGEAVTDAGVAALKKERPDLTVTYESEASDLADLQTSIADVMAGKTTRLTVQGTKVCDRHLADLGTLTKIDSLALNARHLTNATLARIDTLVKLKELDISSSQMFGDGLHHPAKLPALRTLTLDEAQIDDEAIETLKMVPALKHIWVKLGLEPADSEKLKAKMTSALHDHDLHFDQPRTKIDPWE